MTANLRLTILFDNRPSPAGLTALWGFAALIEKRKATESSVANSIWRLE